MWWMVSLQAFWGDWVLQKMAFMAWRVIDWLGLQFRGIGKGPKWVRMKSIFIR